MVKGFSHGWLQTRSGWLGASKNRLCGGKRQRAGAAQNVSRARLITESPTGLGAPRSPPLLKTEVIGEIGGLDSPFARDPVPFAEDDDARFPFLRLRLAEGHKVHNRQPVALLAEMRARVIENDFAGAAFAGNGVGFQPFAVGQVAAQNFS